MDCTRSPRHEVVPTLSTVLDLNDVRSDRREVHNMILYNSRKSKGILSA